MNHTLAIVFFMRTEKKRKQKRRMWSRLGKEDNLACQFCKWSLS